MRMSELADSVLLSRSGLTRLVDRLERQGLLRRERCESDARGLFAEITAEGRRAVRRGAARRTSTACAALFLDRFSRDELRTLGGLWAEARAAPLGHRRGHRVARAAAHLADRAGEPPHALVQLGRVEQRERQPEATSACAARP